MTPSPSITVDDSLWPLLRVTVVGAPTSQQQVVYLSRLSAFLHRWERYAGVLDTSQMRLVTSEQRERQARFMAEHAALFRAHCLGTAAVVSSPLVRLAGNLLIHLKPPPMRYVIVPKLPVALAWAVERLEEAGLSAPRAALFSRPGLSSRE
jgi:hypothetical protein